MRLKKFTVFLLILFACAHLREAENSYQSQDFARTASLCRAALQADSTDAEAWILLSRACLTIDSADQSLVALGRAGKLENRSEKQNGQIVGLYLDHVRKSKNETRSLDLFLTAEKIDSLHMELLDTLASFYYNRGQYEEAGIRYNRLIDLAADPTLYISRVNRIENRRAFVTDEYEQGMKCLQSGKKKLAEEHLKKAVLTDPQFNEAVYQYGMLAGGRLYKAGSNSDLDEAIAVLKQAVLVRPRDAEAHYLLARTYEKRGRSRFQEAIDQYQIVVRLAPQGSHTSFCKDRIQSLEKQKAFWEKGKKQN